MTRSRRFFERQTIFVEGRLVATDNILHGTIVNISPGGAGVLLSSSAVRVPRMLKLVIDTADGTITLSAHVVHSALHLERTYLGLEFDDLPHQRSAKLLPIFAEFVLAGPAQSS